MSDFPCPPPVGKDRQFVLGNHLSLNAPTSADETDGRHDVSDVVIPPADTPLHLRTGYEERIWVVEGALTVWCGADAVRRGHPRPARRHSGGHPG